VATAAVLGIEVPTRGRGLVKHRGCNAQHLEAWSVHLMQELTREDHREAVVPNDLYIDSVV
jgi:hypothetical protein